MDSQKELLEAVRKILRAGKWPEYRTEDDRGLEEDEYVEFVQDVLAALRSAATRDGSREPPVRDACCETGVLPTPEAEKVTAKDIAIKLKPRLFGMGAVGPATAAARDEAIELGELILAKYHLTPRKDAP